MAIPKIIHYCWFSKEPLSPMARKCISTWRKYCPDYKIRQWNSANFDMEINDFVKEAYQEKKWAFVTDFARMYILYHYGGIYMDSDVELCKNIDCFLDDPAFIGLESKRELSAGLIGSEKGNSCIKVFLDYYNGRHFINPDKTLNQTTNVKIMTKNIADTYQVYFNGKKRKIGNIICVYPQDYFSPKSCHTGIIERTENTYAIHNFAGAWLNREQRFWLWMMNFSAKHFGKAYADFFSVQFEAAKEKVK